MVKAKGGRPKLLTVDQTAEFFGGIGRRTVFRWASRGILKPVRLEGRTFFLLGDLLHLIRARRGR